MSLIKKISKYLFLILITLILSSPFWVKNVSLQSLSFLKNKSPVFDDIICRYPVKVSSDSMAPVVALGDTIELSRCFDESDLSEGTLVLYSNDSGRHLGIIRHVLELDPIIYKISNERPHERLQDIVEEEIVAINREIDTSISSYQADSKVSLVLDPEEFLTDLYLGKIPRGFGVEMAEVEKTNTYIKEQDKFCMVVIPKKELAFVDTEIVNSQTKEIVISSKNIVFNVSTKANINCDDFGNDSGMLNLEPGSYHYRFLLNHQALADIPFTIK